MKKWAIGIIVFMSVIFLTGIINVKAYNITNIVGYNDINLNNIDSLNGYNQYYTVLKLNNVWCSYNNNCFYESSYPGMIYLQFYNNYDAGFYDYQDSSSQYYNDICGISEYGCFTRITSSFSIAFLRHFNDVSSFTHIINALTDVLNEKFSMSEPTLLISLCNAFNSSAFGSSSVTANVSLS